MFSQQNVEVLNPLVSELLEFFKGNKTLCAHYVGHTLLFPAFQPHHLPLRWHADVFANGFCRHVSLRTTCHKSDRIFRLRNAPISCVVEVAGNP